FVNAPIEPEKWCERCQTAFIGRLGWILEERRQCYGTIERVDLGRPRSRPRHHSFFGASRMGTPLTALARSDTTLTSLSSHSSFTDLSRNSAFFGRHFSNTITAPSTINALSPMSFEL